MLNIVSRQENEDQRLMRNDFPPSRKMSDKQQAFGRRWNPSWVAGRTVKWASPLEAILAVS